MRQRGNRGPLPFPTGPNPMDRSRGCIAYHDDGRICGNKEGLVLDMQRGGMVCRAHAPKPDTPPEENQHG